MQPGKHIIFSSPGREHDAYLRVQGLCSVPGGFASALQGNPCAQAFYGLGHLLIDFIALSSLARVAPAHAWRYLCFGPNWGKALKERIGDGFQLQGGRLFALPANRSFPLGQEAVRGLVRRFSVVSIWYYGEFQPPPSVQPVCMSPFTVYCLAFTVYLK